jgi:hypothetical protein
MSARRIEGLRYNGPLPHRLRSTAKAKVTEQSLKVSQLQAPNFLVFLVKFLFRLFWVAFLVQSLNPLQVAELKGNIRKFKEDFGRKRKKGI